MPGVPTVAQWVKNPTAVTLIAAEAQVASEALALPQLQHIQFLAWEFPYVAVHPFKKKKKERKCLFCLFLFFFQILYAFFLFPFFPQTLIKFLLWLNSSRFKGVKIRL